MLSSDLTSAIEQYHQSVDSLLTGDPEPQKRIWSRSDDVTLANPLGPPVRGWSPIEKVVDGVASMMRDRESLDYERITEFETPDVAYVLEIERARAKFGGSDEAATVSLRVTTVLRREAGEWKIALRHADPITTPRSFQWLLDEQSVATS